MAEQGFGMHNRKEFLGYPAWHWGGAGIALVVFFVVVAIMPERQSAPRAPEKTEQQRADERLRLDACAAAQDAIKARLRAPSTAKFPGCVFGAHEYRIGMDADRKNIMVLGHVDAQNGFGATIRSQFGVQFENDGGQLRVVKAEVMN